METNKNIKKQQEANDLRGYWIATLGKEYANIMVDVVISQLYPKRPKEEFIWKKIKL